ncbi:MAG: DUF4270 domain-containing protein [Bacteroidia bacterium]|nr:DUF4270 domain-containing protein [Bacteroidia bacterium]
MFFLSLNSCTNNSDEIGMNLPNVGDKLVPIVDESTIIFASTLRQDSLYSQKMSSSLLGSIYDPVFGRSNANLLTQLRLSSNEVDFGVNPQIDSAIVQLKYQGYYGDTTTLQNVRIYELTKDLSFDSTYYSNMDMTGAYDPSVPVADFSYYPKPSQDSLPIRLSEEFGNKLLNTDTANLSNNIAWLAFFKGLYFEPSTVEQGGSIVYFDFAGGESRLTLYFHNDANDSLKFEVVINTNCSWVNLFNHNYSGTTIENLINDSINTHPDVYLQSMAGLRTHLKFEISPSILDKVKSGIAINKAELIITFPDDPTVSSFGRPNSLAVYNATIDGKNEYIQDISMGSTYYGGTLSEKTLSYRFNIALHLQNILSPDTAQQISNNGMFLVIANERTTANRLILNNGTVNGGMKLKITYTPLK